MAIEVQKACLVIRLGKREIKLTKLKKMKSPPVEEFSWRRVEYTEQQYLGKGGRRSMKG